MSGSQNVCVSTHTHTQNALYRAKSRNFSWADRKKMLEKIFFLRENKTLCKQVKNASRYFVCTQALKQWAQPARRRSSGVSELEVIEQSCGYYWSGGGHIMLL